MPQLSRIRRSSESESNRDWSRRLFSKLSVDGQRDFHALGHLVTLAKGAIPFREDEPNRGVFVLCSGAVKLSCTSRLGKTLILKVAFPGDVLGLGAVISGTSYEVTAEMLEPTVVKSIGRRDFLRFLKKYGEASMSAAQALSLEYRIAFFDARRLALSGSAAGRIASILLSWGRSAMPQKRFTMVLTHAELGNLTGTTRETVTRTMTRLQQNKLIEIRGSSVMILAPARLSELAV
jgi:CRP/FNR family cyclic AMP-dependent transcriptional regulator